MKVRTIKPHWNTHGEHAVGAEYDHDNPKADITAGHVEHAGNDKAARDAGDRGKAGAGEKRDGKEQNAKGPARGGGAGRKKDAGAGPR